MTVRARCRLTPAFALVPLMLPLPLLALAQNAVDRAVNPLTGVPLSLEQMHWSLEQARLEEQLQASLLNRRKFELERERLDQVAGGAAAPGSPTSGSMDAAAAAAAAALLAPSTSLSTGVARPAPASAPLAPSEPLSAHRPPVRLHGNREPLTVSSGWPVVGVRAKGTDWCLLLAESGQLSAVCSGEWHGGHHVEAVSAQAYTVDGVSHVLEIPVARLRASAPAPAADTGDGLTDAAATRAESGFESGLASGTDSGTDSGSAPLALPAMPHAALLQSSPAPALQR